MGCVGWVERRAAWCLWVAETGGLLELPSHPRGGHSDSHLARLRPKPTAEHWARAGKRHRGLCQSHFTDEKNRGSDCRCPTLQGSACFCFPICVARSKCFPGGGLASSLAKWGCRSSQIPGALVRMLLGTEGIVHHQRWWIIVWDCL